MLSSHRAVIIICLDREVHISLEEHLPVLLLLYLLIPLLSVLDVKVLIEDVVESLMILLDVPEGF